MRILAVAARWLFVICLPFLLFTASLAWAVNSFWLYQHGLEKYAISRVTGLSQTELDKAASGLIRYFNSSEESISLTVTKDGKVFQLFNEREVVHLRDVKGLIHLDYSLLMVTLGYAVAYAAVSLFSKQRRPLARGVVTGSGLTLALLLALGAGMAFNFDGLFWQFHLISFSNDFWLLDPARDYLVMMFPEPFWYDAARYIALATAGMAAVLGAFAAGYLRFTRTRADA